MAEPEDPAAQEPSENNSESGAAADAKPGAEPAAVEDSAGSQSAEEKEELVEPVQAEDALSDLLGDHAEEDSATGDLDGLMSAMGEAREGDGEVDALAQILAGNPSSESVENDSSGGSGASAGRASLSGVAEEDLQRMLKIKVPFKVVLAERETLVRDLITMQVGSLIEFEKLNDELLDVYINEHLLGLGEVVKIHENFGIRLREIISPQERIRKLGL